jgi:glycosyltransferase involved in cell wall biosynthesis
VDRLSGHLEKYDVYHAWNAVQVGKALVEQGVDPVRIVITWTGTDLWGDWVRDSAGIQKALSGIRQQVVFTPNARLRLLQDAPEWDDVVQVIPPSVDDEIFSPEEVSLRRSPPLVVLAGGVRPVKRSAWAIELIDEARQRLGQDLQLAILGPVRDVGEWQKVLAGAQERAWVRVVGELPTEQMANWYRRAAFVLNSSRIEGVSNALMEAMGCGALIVATNIHGNRYLVEQHKTGILFDDAHDFVEQLRWAFAHSDEVECIRRNARMRILSQHMLIQEAEAYLALYRHALASCPRRCGL